VTLYIFLVGINLAQRISDSYNVNDAKHQLRWVVDRMLIKSVDEDLVTSFAAQIGTLIASNVLSSPEVSVNCSSLVTDNGASIVDSYCNSTAEGYAECEKNVSASYLCALLDGSQSLNISQVLPLWNASGMNTNMIMNITRNMLQQSVDATIDSLYPSSKYMVTVPVGIAVFMATFCAFYLAVTYLASVTSTILKLRCGILPTLEKPDFARYRIAPDTVSMLTGSLFWGCFGASLLSGGLFGLIAFFFLWQGTVYFAQRVVALFIGIISVALIRICVVRTCRASFYQAFYRKRPAAANISLLALEWANFALSAGFIIVRTIKLLLVAGFSIGRIDKPMLAEGLGRIGGLELDGYPTIHMRDVLLTEAHRHPYIEALGTMYLMKLRYAEDFGKNSGTCWRLVFVYALMPWLHKYRVLTRPKLFDMEFTGDDTESQRHSKSLRFMSLQYLLANNEQSALSMDGSSDANGETGTKPEATAGNADDSKETIRRLRARISAMESELVALRSQPSSRSPMSSTVDV
jgi:hypothetical protein